MENEILKEYMLLAFSDTELRKYLDDNILKTLSEWKKDDEAVFKKLTLAELIISIYGVNILKDNEFRKKLLKSFKEEEINSFKELLPKKYRQETDLNELRRVISKQQWKKSEVTKHFLEILGYSEEMVFEDQEDMITAINKIESYEEFYELLDYQYIIKQKALTKLEKDPGAEMLIHMPTGTGKTKTATHLVTQYYNYNLHKKGLIVWIAHTEELLEQAYETFEKVWRHIGNGKIKTFRMYGDYNITLEEELSGFMICGIHKLERIYANNKELFQKIKENTRLIVYDEAHKAGAPKSKEVIKEMILAKGNMAERALIGLSATPGRKSGISFDNDLLVSMFGNSKIEIEPYLMNYVNYSEEEALNMEYTKDIIKYFQERKVLAKLVKEELTYKQEFTKEELKQIKDHIIEAGYEEKDFSDKELEILGKNRNRNLKIVQRLIELNSEKKPTIVFACSVQHARLLSAMLKLENVPNVLIVGEMNPAERRMAIKKFKSKENDINIIINYGVLTTGFDSTNIQCVFIARPTQSIVLYSQMIGRGLRGPKMGGNEECLLIDVKDNLNIYDEHMAFSKFDNYWKII
ncbi:MAG: DEAD/DEAH box helicase family protein [Clostridia bacterium]|jgi:DNA repair protein RadD|nr:DEAD/DEAH box helicase family protein [Clostridia bacterium]